MSCRDRLRFGDSTLCPSVALGFRGAARWAFILVIVLVRPTRAAADAQYELLLKDRIAAENVLADLLADVTDSQSGSKAEPLLKASLERRNGIARRLHALPKPAREEDERLKALYDAKTKDAHQRVEHELSRVKEFPDLPATLRELLQQLSEPPGTSSSTSQPAGAQAARAGSDRVVVGAVVRRRPGPTQAPPASRFGPERTVRLNLQNAGDRDVVKAVHERLQQIVTSHSPSGHSFSGRTANGAGEVMLAPLDMPLEEFAKEIDFGKVTRVSAEDRVIDVTITWTRATLPSAADDPKPGRRPGP